jgi:lipopolysaccharide export system permease protein
MRILTRYVLFDLLKVFLLTLTGLTAIIFVALIGKEAVDKGIGLGPLLRMTPYLLPQSLQFAIPGTMLLATTSVYGRMASYNEVVAIKSLGISPMVVIWPSLVLATLVSLLGVVMNDIAVSWGVLGVQRVFLESIEEVTYSQLRVKRTYNLGKANITVRAVDGHRLISPTLIVQSSADRPGLTLSADEAELHSYPDQGKLVVVFRNMEAEGSIAPSMPGSFALSNPNEYEYVASLDELTGTSDKMRSPSTYALAEIGPAVARQEGLVRQTERSMAVQAAFGMLTGDFNAISDAAWKIHEDELATGRTRLNRLHTEAWRRWANGFSCLCFVLIGAPVAIWFRHSEFLASFFICFLPILVVYYPLLAVSVDWAKDGTVPPQAVWIGNIVLALAGVWLLRRVNRN